jgi:hypothetical protein
VLSPAEGKKELKAPTSADAKKDTKAGTPADAKKEPKAAPAEKDKGAESAKKKLKVDTGSTPPDAKPKGPPDAKAADASSPGELKSGTSKAPLSPKSPGKGKGNGWSNTSPVQPAAKKRPSTGAEVPGSPSKKPKAA